MLVICKKRTHTCHAIAMAHSKQVEIQSHRHFLKDPPPSQETPDEELGMKGNPIYVLDDDEIECDGYWDGYWDRTNIYHQYNGLWNEDAKCGKSTMLNNLYTS